MTLFAGELKAVAREELTDQAEPYLWLDTDLYRYIDDAQKMFCRKTDGISDVSSTLTTLSVVPNQGFITLDRRILRIRAAYRADTGAPIEVMNFQDMQAR